MTSGEDQRRLSEESNSERFTTVAATMFVMMSVLLTMLLLSYLWEFWGEAALMTFFGLPYDAEFETEERWRFIVTAVCFAGISLVVPAIIMARSATSIKRMVHGLKAERARALAAEGRLLQMQRMEAVGQLTGGVAHDFNNLLAVIMGNSEILADRLGNDDKVLNAIVRAANRGSELTQRLLAYSRQQSLRPQAIDLGALVSGMSELLVRTLGETMDIKISAMPGLWAASADPGQVENALLNLALNARDAMPDGGKLTIECENVHLDEADTARNPEVLAGDYVVLAVNDNGTGMSAEIQEKAFEPFFTTKDVGQGSGLGLSMVYGFAKQSGGHVTIYSELDRGTTVKLYLPRAQEEAQGKVAQKDPDIPRGRGETILVIEDDPDVRELAVRSLKGLGYRVIEAVDAAEARMLLARRKRVDLVLSDVILPGGISGPEFAAEARTDYPDLKIVFMSGYPAEAIKGNNFLDSHNVLLNKPFQRQNLAKALREALIREVS